MGGSKEKPAVVWQRVIDWLYITNNGIYEPSTGFSKTPIVLSPYIAIIRNDEGMRGMISTSSLSTKSETMNIVFYKVKVQYYSDGELVINV